MRLTVIGCGYLGAVHAAAMADIGHTVLGIDVDPQRVRTLQSGQAPFYEPGLPELLARKVGQGTLRFAALPERPEQSDTGLGEALAEDIRSAQVHFITVGTPQTQGSDQADLSQVWAAVDLLRDVLPERGRRAGSNLPLVVGKSTVPAGTAQEVARRLADRALTVWNPEFLREGFAVADTLHPDRIVYGLPPQADEARSARELLDEAYTPLLAEGIARLTTDYATAELVKTAANSFLAMKISFINAMSTMCEAAGADVTVLAQALGHDARIGHRFLRAGVGFGGGCLPKDIRALRASAQDHGVETLAGLLGSIDAINQRQRDHVVDLAVTSLGAEVRGAAVTVLGAAFKPNSDDVRDSPALEVADRLARLGARVTIHDPQAMGSLHRSHPLLTPAPDAQQALMGAQVVILATEWEEYTGLDPLTAAALVERPVVIDARNALDPQAWRAAGWHYRGVGR